MRWPFLLTALLVVAPLCARAQSESRSYGSPNRGRLRHAAELTPSSRVRLTHEPARYGTAELVTLLDRGAAAVQRAHAATPPLVVGDLSRRRGGRFPPHLSHQAGRDADVGFYYVDAEGRPFAAEEFIAVSRSGRCVPTDLGCRLDVARTWDLVASILRDEDQVQYVVIARYLRDLLLDEAERRAAPSDLVTRFRLVTAPLAQSREHRNHFHLRIYCAADDRPRCHDEGPLHPWYVYPPNADPEFVARSRERGLERFVAEREAEPRDRERRRRIRERIAARERAAAQARQRAEARLERIRARRRAAREAREEARREEREARLARLERRRAAQQEARRRREALRAMSPDERRAHLRRQAAEEAAREEARRAEVRRVMAERALARREAAERRRAERRARYRDRQRRERERAQARRAAYVAHLEARRSAD